jgi:hypothetical protein
MDDVIPWNRLAFTTATPLKHLSGCSVLLRLVYFRLLFSLPIVWEHLTIPSAHLSAKAASQQVWSSWFEGGMLDLKAPITSDQVVQHLKSSDVEFVRTFLKDWKAVAVQALPQPTRPLHRFPTTQALEHQLDALLGTLTTQAPN